jgi:uncharacterized membrane protein
MKILFFKSILIIFDCIFVNVVYMYVLNNFFKQFVDYHSPNNISSGLTFLILLPFVVFIRIATIQIKILFDSLFIIQNVFLFNFYFLDKIALKNDFIKVYSWGILSIFIFFQINTYLIKKIENN